jgi:hypothetical protein
VRLKTGDVRLSIPAVPISVTSLDFGLQFGSTTSSLYLHSNSRLSFPRSLYDPRCSAVLYVLARSRTQMYSDLRVIVGFSSLPV